VGYEWRFYMGSGLVAPKGLFRDKMYTSTDLNRRAGEILNSARCGPVTISRNNEQFALMKREQAASLVNTANNLNEAMELIRGALYAIAKRPVSQSVSWLTAFDKDDLFKFVDEILVTSRQAGDWEQLDAVVHEWHESAMAMSSGIAGEILEEGTEIFPLTDPLAVTEQESELVIP
jgi:hypothetical protein